VSSLFDQPVTDVIRRRSSWRSYEHRPIAPATLEALQARLRRLPAPPFGGRTRVELHEVPGVNHRALGAFGTYGMIKGAHHYLVGAMGKSDRDHEDFGYAFEHAILAATDLGLGTCWLGGALALPGQWERWPTPPAVGPLPDHTSYLVSWTIPG